MFLWHGFACKVLNEIPDTLAIGLHLNFNKYGKLLPEVRSIERKSLYIATRTQTEKSHF